MKIRIPIFIWLVLGVISMSIFLLSAQTAPQSTELSTGVLEHLLQKTMPAYDTLPEGEQQQLVLSYHHIARKYAHFIIYSVWGVVLSALMYIYGLRRWRFVTAVLIIGFIFAGSDELHQWFVPGRGAQWSDVGLDVFGVITGMFLFLVAKEVKYRQRIRKENTINL
ncbi:VanZ family protein [Ructibacterium gallinarum]|uniref:VanZ family protein n=1 Tax=Ructibacterium gallinarum TaxID=2779355 RepID=A0A9D5M137_9FIRM|nr:VanZ family protein [Ructibacterium gallinarum]MBE5039503.1 VanZ family protein [Ructibacterium gallinarum]